MYKAQNTHAHLYTTTRRFVCMSGKSTAKYINKVTLS